ncbi:putative membrane protein YcfT [Microbacterium halimionae]|uniref:Putative membrane protein YcfT n=1 Tax=Microbacterium halimionae TaxID=1526413 RepID=A0A7W3PL37_9MICO|nr:acyltransferase family protein [Microbacterium halimionae]MBA8815547.1 putative membrane protein YcfT [Microbacterium halimionae]NII95594.1 putative membrane protein YcfT [Microbacterium halimionae]
MTARVGWPDVAKGICITLVVLWHVMTKHAIDADRAGAITHAWATLNAQLLPLRMPLFFLISGMFAGRAVNAADGNSWRRRAGRLAAVYVVWVVIQTFVLALTPDFDTASAENGWQLLAQLTISPTNLWYLLALAVYLLVARLVRHAPTVVLLPGAFVIAAVAAAGLLPDLGNFWQVVQNLFFFLAGLRLRAAIERFAAGASLLRTVMLGAAYVAALGAVGMLGIRQRTGVWPLLAIVAVAFGVAACAMIDRHVRVVARPLRWVGQRTLPIYVIHMIPLALIDGALRTGGWAATPVVEVVWPMVLTAVVIAICLAVHAGLQRVGLGVLFDPLLLIDRASSPRSQ